MKFWVAVPAPLTRTSRARDPLLMVSVATPVATDWLELRPIAQIPEACWVVVEPHRIVASKWVCRAVAPALVDPAVIARIEVAPILMLRTGVRAPPLLLRYEMEPRTVMVSPVVQAGRVTVEESREVAALGWSFCFFIVCLAQPLVRGLYGHQWDPAVDLTRQLALATALQVPATLCQTALLSSGAVSTIARATVVTALQSMVFISLGASQSLFMLGFALMASAAVSSTLWLRATCQHMGLPVRHLLAMLGNSLGVAVASALGPLVVLLWFGPYPEAVWLPLGLASLGALLGGWWGVQLFRHPLQEEIRRLWGSLKLRVFQAKPAP